MIQYAEKIRLTKLGIECYDLPGLGPLVMSTYDCSCVLFTEMIFFLNAPPPPPLWKTLVTPPNKYVIYTAVLWQKEATLENYAHFS